jgi:Leucine-rich repeat (LRR) protein
VTTSYPPCHPKLATFQLLTLALYRNQLTVLPREIGYLTNLITLFLDDNQLTKLPPELERLTQQQI